jgi:hypothetical protein
MAAHEQWLSGTVHPAYFDAERDYKRAGGSVAVRRLPGSVEDYNFATLIGKKEQGRFAADAPKHRAEQNRINEEYARWEYGDMLDNPKGRRAQVVKRAKYVSAREAGLARGQSLMAQAAEAYHAGKYPNMAMALKGVSGKGRR